ncbi:hypothetical protein J42TS3_06770 [Paenibacillus vini]|uniref:Uncharacterized protein n=1 Tax=Paenibacillus vini TaxID=1476024 RepID=A0ABQ4M7M9_9BACL|nr:hypothetical protein J42TS3_06770 [Paenibacillus vini]
MGNLSSIDNAGHHRIIDLLHQGSVAPVTPSAPSVPSVPYVSRSFHPLRQPIMRNYNPMLNVCFVNNIKKT